MKILIAGFQHETNTFAPTKAGYANFVRGEGYPAMSRGAAVLDLRTVNIPAGGFIEAAEAAGHALEPVIWAAASPSAHVTEEAFEKIVGEIVEAAARFQGDAVYLDLHGAMVTEHHDDGEGEVLRRVREAVGPDMPIVASLDLHANMTQLMFDSATALVAYRTYPHVDMAETGKRAFDLLVRLRETPLKLIVRRLPFLIPINGMCTMLEPSLSMYSLVGKLESDSDAVASLSFAPGFPAADFPECGALIWGYGSQEDATTAAVEHLYQKMLAEESLWSVPFLSPDDAVLEAMRLSEGATKPVVIADTQDNPGAGADSDTTGMLRALLKHGVKDAAVGLIWDPEAVALAQAAGVGAEVEIALGGRSGAKGDSPFVGRFHVELLSDGRCRFDGPMMNGMEANVGPVACLRIDGVRIVVSAGKSQMLDRNLYRVGGVQPEQMKILVNKSSVHFRADFEPIAHAVLVAKAPGPMSADPADLPWTRLRPGIRLRPNGPQFAG